MKEFKIRPGGFDDLQKIAMKRVRIITASLPIVVLVIASTASGTPIWEDTTVLLVIALCVLSGTVISFFIAKKGIELHRSILESYTLTFEGSLITREQDRTPPIALYEGDITSIAKTSKGAYVIKGKEGRDMILVPNVIDNVAELEQELLRIAPIERYKSSTDRVRAIALIVLLPSAMIGLYFSDEAVIVVPAAITLMSVMAWLLFAMNKHKRNIDETARKRMWILYLIYPSFLFLSVVKVVKAVPYLSEKFPVIANMKQR